MKQTLTFTLALAALASLGWASCPLTIDPFTLVEQGMSDGRAGKTEQRYDGCLQYTLGYREGLGQYMMGLRNATAPETITTPAIPLAPQAQPTQKF